jgi:hypothetical protein
VFLIGVGVAREAGIWWIALEMVVVATALQLGYLGGSAFAATRATARWTLRLLENKVVELNIVDRASDSTIGRVLKKTLSSPIADSNGSFRRRPTARS